MRHFLLALFVSGLIVAVWQPLARTSSAPGPDSDVLASLALPSGQMVIAGRFSDNRIARLNSDGTLDPSFQTTWSTGGFNGTVWALALQADGSIVVGGDFGNFDTAILGHVARLHPDGSMDTDFATAIGTGFDDAVTTIAIQSDGKILVGGRFTSFNGTKVTNLARLAQDGSLDSAFAGGAAFDFPVTSLAILPSGGILVANDTSAAGFHGQPLVRLTASGQLDVWPSGQ